MNEPKTYELDRIGVLPGGVVETTPEERRARLDVHHARAQAKAKQSNPATATACNSST